MASVNRVLSWRIWRNNKHPASLHSTKSLSVRAVNQRRIAFLTISIATLILALLTLFSELPSAPLPYRSPLRDSAPPRLPAHEPVKPHVQAPLQVPAYKPARPPPGARAPPPPPPPPPAAAGPPPSSAVVRGLEEPPKGVFLPNAPLHAINPTGTKDVGVAPPGRPKWGFPPRTVHPSHPQYKLLRRLRTLTKLTPRWPDFPELPAYLLRSYADAYSSILISDKLKVVYVPVFKVGTTSVMYTISYLENKRVILNANLSDPGTRDYMLHDFGTNLWNDQAAFTVSNDRLRAALNDPSYLKFGFVRNPYHRIVSCYLDRIVKFDLEAFEYQEQMYGLYGNDNAIRKLRNTTKPTFKEFLVAIEKVLEKPRTPTTDLSKPQAYENEHSRRELHWRPQVELLHPDLIHLDFVGYMETMDEDKKYVLEWMYQFTDRRVPDRPRLHTTSALAKVKLLQQIREDDELRQVILRTYKVDFERFGFSTAVPTLTPR